MIHCSEEYPALSFCSVQIVFRSINTLNQHVDEFMVERKVYRDTGRSEYLLNGVSHSLSEITQTMQQDLGIDLSHHRWLILQGEVESIAMMKPCSSAGASTEEGLLEYLEDIIGSAALLPEIENCEMTWNAASAASNIAQGKLQLAEADVQGMQIEVDEALKNATQFNEIQKRRMAIMRLLLEKSQNLQEQLHAKIGEMHDDQKKLSEDIQEKKEQLSEYRSHCQREERETKTIQDALNLERNHVEQAERSVLKQRERHVLAKRAVDQADKNCAKMIQKSEEAASAMEEAKKIPDELAKLQLELEKQRALLPSEATRGNDLLLFRQERASISKELRAIETMETEKVSLNNEIDSIIKELTLLNQRECALNEEKTALEKLHPELSALVTSKECMVMELAAEVGNQHEESTAGDGKSLESVVSSMPGIIGRLGDLLSLSSDNYAIAFERAAGALLDQWVVENGADGQRCIDELRRKQLGRATFVVLSELQKAPVSTSNYPGKGDNSIVRLFDVVKPVESRFASLAYYAVRGETLVAPTLDAGTKLAFGTTQRYRVVTIDGELIEPSGAMSGGGGAAPRRKKKQPTQLHHLRQELAQRRQELEQSQMLLLETTQRIEAITSIELPGLKERFASLKAQEKKLLVRMETIGNGTSSQNEVTRLSSRLTEIEMKITEHQKQSPQLELLVNLEERFRELENRQLDANPKALAHVSEQALKGAEEHLSVARQAEQTALALLSKMEEELSLVKQKLAMMEQQFQAREPSLSSLRNEMERLESELAKMDRHFEDLVQSLKKSHAEVTDLKRKCERTKEMLTGSVWVVDLERPSERLYYSEELLPFSFEKPDTLEEAMLSQLERQADDLWQTSFTGVLAAWNARQAMAREATMLAQAASLDKEAAWTALDAAKRARLDLFMSGFREISDSLKSIYQIITLGGNAELELVDSLDPFSEGVLFSVMPPKKAWKNISQLSGGEKVFLAFDLVSFCFVMLCYLFTMALSFDPILYYCCSCYFHIRP